MTEGWESLDDDVRGLSHRGAPSGCGIQKLLDTLDKKDADAVLAVLGNHTYTHMAIRQALIRRGHTLSYSVVQRHRIGTCACEREL